jgi:16S rRNA (cytosine967-C5)-methyltransferase
MRISPARLAAFDVLHRIEKDRAFSSVLLPIYEEKLNPPDRGLCHELVLGVLRRQIYLDEVVRHYAGSKKLDTAVRIALRLGAYQILFLEKVPGYSAVNESVNLVQKARKTSAKSFVNAILRRVAEKGAPEFTFRDEIERISIETSHPRWLVEKWTTEFGSDEAEKIAVANNSVPKTSFRFIGDRVPDGFEACEFVPDCYVTSSITPDLREMMERDEIYFQDEASQLVAHAVAQDVGDSFLDVCAAPGGKTTRIAREGRPTLAIAGDIHAARVDHLRNTCRRQAVGFVNIVQYDAEQALPFADKTFDTVLVDAPCTGTGTIRGTPEIRYFLSPNDFDDLQKKQLAILKSASNSVTPGGRLIYSTCSLEREENEVVCADFLAQTTEFEKVSPRIPEPFITADGFGRTFPHRDATDGFFIAEFRRHGI